MGLVGKLEMMVLLLKASSIMDCNKVGPEKYLITETILAAGLKTEDSMGMWSTCINLEKLAKAYGMKETSKETVMSDMTQPLLLPRNLRIPITISNLLNDTYMDISIKFYKN